MYQCQAPHAAGDGAKLGNLPATAKRGRANNARFTRMKHGLHRRYNGERRSAFPQKHEPPRGEPAKAVPLRGPLYFQTRKEGAMGYTATAPRVPGVTLLLLLWPHGLHALSRRSAGDPRWR